MTVSSECVLAGQIATIAISSLVALLFLLPVRKPPMGGLQIALFVFLVYFYNHLFILYAPTALVDDNAPGWTVWMAPFGLALVTLGIAQCTIWITAFVAIGGGIAMLMRLANPYATPAVSATTAVIVLVLVYGLLQSKPAEQAKNAVGAIAFTVAASLIVAIGTASALMYYKYAEPFDDAIPCTSNVNMLLVCEIACGSVTTDRRWLSVTWLSVAVGVAIAARLAVIFTVGFDDASDMIACKRSDAPVSPKQTTTENNGKGNWTQLDTTDTKRALPTVQRRERIAIV